MFKDTTPLYKISEEKGTKIKESIVYMKVIIKDENFDPVVRV